MTCTAIQINPWPSTGLVHSERPSASLLGRPEPEKAELMERIKSDLRAKCFIVHEARSIKLFPGHHQKENRRGTQAGFQAGA